MIFTYKQWQLRYLYIDSGYLVTRKFMEGSTMGSMTHILKFVLLDPLIIQEN